MSDKEVINTLISDYSRQAKLSKRERQIYEHGILTGFDVAKQIMMTDAVHGNVDYPFIGHDFPNIYPDYRELKDYCDRHKIKDNDKVKLIIIKED